MTTKFVFSIPKSPQKPDFSKFEASLFFFLKYCEIRQSAITPHRKPESGILKKRVVVFVLRIHLWNFSPIRSVVLEIWERTDRQKDRQTEWLTRFLCINRRTTLVPRTVVRGKKENGFSGSINAGDSKSITVFAPIASRMDVALRVTDPNYNTCKYVL